MEEGAFIIRHDALEFVNRRVLGMLHLKAEDVLGRPPSMVLPNKVWTQLEPLIAKARSSKGRPVTADITWQDAGYGDVRLKFHVVSRDDSLLVQVSSAPTQKRGPLDTRMAELRERLAAMLGFIASSGIGVAFFERDETGRFMTKSVNDHFCAILGRREDELIGNDPCDLVHPDDQPRAREHMSQLWEEGMAEQPVELNLVDAAGEPVHAQVSTTILSEPSGNVAVCFVQDVTAFDMALEEQRKFALAIEHVEETVVLTDGAGRIFYANPSALRNSGYRLEEVIGKPISIFHAPETVGPVGGQALQEFMRSGYWRGDIMACSKDGVRYPVEVIGSLVRDERGRPSMIIVVSRRIDERQRYEAELLLARRHMDYLTDVVTKDLKNALARAVELLDQSSAEGGVPKDMRGKFETLLANMDSIKAVADRASAMSVDLASARELRAVRLPQLLRERIKEVSYRHPGIGLRYELDFKDDDIVVMVNDLLFELLHRLERVAVFLASGRSLTIKLSLTKVASPEKPDGNPTFARMVGTLEGILLPEELRGAFSRREEPIKLRTTIGGGEVANAIETANLITFLFRGQIFMEDIDPASPEKGFKFIILLPLEGAGPPPQGPPPMLEDLGKPGR